ncbi:MAG TPA: type II secretion system F family protein [Thermoguttaceae bacterium]|nr:type II secretion system F family protein [Thermoguttaceae bacterium]
MARDNWFIQHARVSSKKHKRVTLDDKMTFFQQLSTLVASGTPLLEAIQTCAEQSQSERMTGILKEVAGRVAAGSSLHDVLLAHRGVFEDHWIELIGIGEVSGEMSMVLTDLNKQVLEANETRRKVKGALMYPVILLIVAVVLIVAMLSFVVPTFTDMFKEMGAELPGITQFVVNLSDRVLQYGLYVFVSVVVIVVSFRQYMRTETGLRTVVSVLLVVPMAGELLVQSAMYRFASNLALLLKSGVPMLETLSTMATVFQRSPPYRDAIRLAQNRVAAGKPLADSLEETGLFTTMMTNMVRIGEQSAQLAPVMEQLAPYYKEKMQGFIAKTTKLMEPFIIVFMGGTIATLMLAIYIPMFEMSGKVH